MRITREDRMPEVVVVGSFKIKPGKEEKALEARR